jgi:hypothetical protein
MNIYSKVYFGLLLITLFSYVIAFRKKGRFAIQVILLMLLWLLTSFTAIWLIQYGGLKNNLFVFHISTPLEYIVLAMLYRKIIASAAVKKMILFSIPAFLALCILFSVFIQTPDTNNSYTIIMESVILVLLSLFFLRETLLLQQITVLHRYGLFWISVGILFYFTGNLVIEGMLNYMIDHSMELAKRMYRLGYIFKYLLFILFIIGAFSDKTLIPSSKKPADKP